MKFFFRKIKLFYFSIGVSILFLFLICIVYSYPTSGPSSINKSELLIVKLNNFFNSNKCPPGEFISKININGTFTCGTNSDLRTGVLASAGGITFPTSTPNGVNKEGSIMGAVRNFFNSTCSSTGQFISGTNSNGQKTCGNNAGSNLNIQSQGLTFNSTSPTGGNKNGIVLSKAYNFFNTQCSSSTYLAGVNTDGSKYCQSECIELGGHCRQPKNLVGLYAFGTNPCPSGYHVPTIQECYDAINTGHMEILKFPDSSGVWTSELGNPTDGAVCNYISVTSNPQGRVWRGCYDQYTNRHFRIPVRCMK